ncbi:L,D-transpeptidase [Thalassobius sp. Cn5-15]|uniref:L,D-transpeptidase n=1 Tax=Thalassobius sp. Cn5-15 TaxID=2917763 RepID=UPI001EF3BD0D|nr:L,D-transpeptidase [Thalassobius sp. Cn5-15]MCG7493356.1 L,D-transpeptidase [Thalassobius sp. Cn5-15]
MKRRHFLTTAAAATATLAMPSIARAFEVEQKYLPQDVAIKSDVEPGQILVLPQAHFLYLVTGVGTARRYGVGVGKAGLEFKGDAIIQRKAKWPSWRPTPEMIKRDPSAYGKFIDNEFRQPGGPKNPLGARALYLYKDGRDTYFRIHGTTQPRTIGRSVSNGCIRMINDHVTDLYDRVPRGTKVTVI